MVDYRKIGNLFTVTVTREFNHPIEKVFDAWLDPVGIGNWLFATPEGKNKICEVDPCEGGDFVIGEQREDGYAKHIGTFHEIDRPNRLAFSYYYEGADDNLASNVIVDFTETATGCQVSVTHEMDDVYAEHEDSAINGWTMIFDGLEKILN